MKNTWLIRSKLRAEFPINTRVMITGPFLNIPQHTVLDVYLEYLAELGTVVDYEVNRNWVGVLLDKDVELGRVTHVWFEASEITEWEV